MSQETTVEHVDRGVFSSPQRATATLVGGLLTLVGIAGFLVPGNELVVFGVNALHNAFHLVTGVIGVALGYYAVGQYADEYNKTMGVVYGALLLLGLVLPEFTDDLLNAAGAPDLVLHAVLATVFLAVGFFAADR